MRRISYIIILLCTAVLMTSCITKDSVSRIGIELKKVQVRDMTNTGFKATLYMQVDNPNWFTVRISDMDYQLLINGQESASGRIEREIEIPGHGSAVAELPAEVGVGNLDVLLNDILKGNLKYRVKGKVVFKTMLGSYTLPFDKEKEIRKEKQAPGKPEAI